MAKKKINCRQKAKLDDIKVDGKPKKAPWKNKL
jgi:hypothetical protein